MVQFVYFGRLLTMDYAALATEAKDEKTKLIDELIGAEGRLTRLKPEIQAMSRAFADFESIHAEAYARLNEELGLDNFAAFLEDEFDCVIHLAALVNVGESEVKPIQYYITNLNGTMNVLIFYITTEYINNQI